MHVHATSVDGLQYLQDRLDSGDAIGPPVWKAGLIDCGGQCKASTQIYVGTCEQTEAAVVRHTNAGYVRIKL